jgi:hypothetical protein
MDRLTLTLEKGRRSFTKLQPSLLLQDNFSTAMFIELGQRR